MFSVEKWQEGLGKGGGGGGVSLHPDFDLDDVPGWIRGVGGGVQYILPYDSDGRDSAIELAGGLKRYFWDEGRTNAPNVHGTVGKDDGNANLLRSTHMQRPKQRHRHEQEHEINKDVAKAENVLHVVRLRFAYRGRSNSQRVTERRG